MFGLFKSKPKIDMDLVSREAESWFYLNDIRPSGVMKTVYHDPELSSSDNKNDPDFACAILVGIGPSMSTTGELIGFILEVNTDVTHVGNIPGAIITPEGLATHHKLGVRTARRAGMSLLDVMKSMQVP